MCIRKAISTKEQKSFKGYTFLITITIDVPQAKGYNSIMESINMNGIKKGFAFFSAVSLVGACLAYYYPLSLVVMSIVPCLWTIAAFKSGRFAYVTLLALSLLTYLYGVVLNYGTLFSLWNVGFIAPAGVLLYTAHRIKLGNVNTVLFLSVLLTFGLFLVFCMPSLWETGNAYSQIIAYFSQILSAWPTQDIFGVNIQTLLSSIEDIFLSYLYVMGVFFSMSNVLFLRLLNIRKKELSLCPMGRFGTWRLPKYYVWAMMAVVIIGTVLLYTRNDMKTSGINLLFFMSQTALVMVGANVFFQLLGRRFCGKKHVWFYILFMCILLITGIGIYMLSFLGLLASLQHNRIRKEQA